MLHGYDDLVLVISAKSLRYQDHAHLVFDDEFL